MSKITIKTEDYNKLSLITRARLSIQEVDIDVSTANREDMILAREKQIEAIKYIGNNRVLVNATSLDRVYYDLVVLAHETERIAEVCNHTTLKALQAEIISVCFSYVKCYGELNRFIREGEE